MAAHHITNHKKVNVTAELKISRRIGRKKKHFLINRDGDICKYQYRYHIGIFFTTIYDIDISHPLKTADFQFFMKYTVTHVPTDQAFIT